MTDQVTPEVTPEVTPDVDAVNMSQERVDETAKGEHEPVAFVKLETWVSGESWPDDCFSDFEFKDSVPLYTAPPKREWVWLTKDEVDSWKLPDSPTVFEFAQFIEEKLKEKNGG